ncbi:MAG: stage 0 sporulation family protein [Clostridia bacterium]|nr:stage 0 sporulation family protein [Clostridia bacterium]MDH7573361.1 stage 0 sporulation family protein [Clostridia bacterium]
MVRIVGVRFRRAGKIYYFDPGEQELAVGDKVLVETVRGLEYGEVVVGTKAVSEEEIVTPLRPVIRRVTAEDQEVLRSNTALEKEAFAICQQKIREHGLPMKLVGAEYTFDRSRLTFYFTAEGRVDFRQLVRDLAAVFRTRIELRQIGVRDEAKLLGGLGGCGRELCCASFLGEFDPVSIRMAKDQNLSLNPVKISGICGRLMCCLRFENDLYEEARNGYPEIGQRVLLESGPGRVVGINVVKGTVTVELEESKVAVEVPREEVGQVEEQPDGGLGPD